MSCVVRCREKLVLAVLMLASPFGWAAPGADQGQIIIGSAASALEQYAARELQRYLYQCSGTLFEIRREVLELQGPSFVVGQRHTNPLIKKLAADGQINVSPKEPGPQGYVLKKLVTNGLPTGDKLSPLQTIIVVAGSDEVGCLYGVYGLLADYYGVSFYPTGDVLPEKSPLRWVEVDEQKAPAMAIRGLLPWSNFPQSPSSYSWEDWKFLIDRMARMRLNFLNLHNYSGERNYNEAFAGFKLDGFVARPAMATARTGHVWHGVGWSPSEYLFQAGDLFDDYDFGSDAALHNESLSNEQVLAKGVSLFQKIIAYAHSRGVQVGLGLDINLIPAGYTAGPEDPRVIAARVNQIASDYPDLDYLICYQSEEADKDDQFFRAWREIFMGFYNGLKARSPGTRLAVSGWGLAPKSVASLPADVICAPIAKYSPSFESGAAYGDREYWGCPWLERDQVSSQYYYPYNMHLSQTIGAYRKRAPNMKGFHGLTWRLSDAIEPKLSYLSRVPWDTANRLGNAKAVYAEYAANNYGPEAALELARTLNENEPFASDFAECQGTAMFTPQKRPGGLKAWFRGNASEYSKCREQLMLVEKWIANTSSPARQARLQLLRARLEAVQDHLLLNDHFETYRWEDLPGAFPSWVRHFTERVTDISSLGNVVSVQNRFVQLRYLVLENGFRTNQAARAPSNVSARGTKAGAMITWKNEQPGVSGFNVYRGEMKLNAAALGGDARTYTDQVNGSFRYTVKALDSSGRASPRSVPGFCAAGAADKTPPQIVLISPPTSSVLGQPVRLKVRVLDNRVCEELSVNLYYRAPRTSHWTKLALPRRVKAIFAGSISGTDLTSAGLEYYLEASDGENVAVHPPAAPQQCLSLTVTELPQLSPPGAPKGLAVAGQGLSWQAAEGEVFWYRIYRSAAPDFQPGPATFLTYVDKNTRAFKDLAEDYDGRPLQGARYYRVTAEGKLGNEGSPSECVRVEYAGAQNGAR